MVVVAVRRSRAIRRYASDVDHLWQHALQRQDFDLLTRSVEASHALHRALLALADTTYLIGIGQGTRPLPDITNGPAS